LLEPIIQFYWNNDQDYIKIDLNELFIKNNKQFDQFILSNLLSIKLESKQKLGPLVMGAIIASLALINILLEGASLYMIGLLSMGFLILYAGLSEYWTLTIDTVIDKKHYWISKAKSPQFPLSFINLIDYKISKGVIPPLYCYIDTNNFSDYLNNSNGISQSISPIEYYLIPPQKIAGHSLIKVDVSYFNKPIEVVLGQSYIAQGNYKINKAALINIEV